MRKHPGQLRLDLSGQQFGLLTVLHHAGRDRFRQPYWCCRCQCGVRCTVRQGKLRAGRQVSCGCNRADPFVRKRARSEVSSELRHQIARLGAQSVHHRGRPFATTISQAAHIARVPRERIATMAEEGKLRSTVRRGRIYLSKMEVAALAKDIQRKAKTCRHYDKADNGQ